MSKKLRFIGPFDKQHDKWDQTVLKYESHHFYGIWWSLWRQLSTKKCLSVIGKLSELFFNILSAGQKYSLLNRDNLTQPSQMQLSLKEKTFSEFLLRFLTYVLRFEHFQTKDDFIADVFLKLETPKTVVR